MWACILGNHLSAHDTRLPILGQVPDPGTGSPRMVPLVGGFGQGCAKVMTIAGGFAFRITAGALVL